jgi:predicted secreted protein
MIDRSRTIAIVAAFVAASIAHAQPAPQGPLPAVPVVSVVGVAASAIANDRMHASLRAEADAATAAAGASEVNARIAQALARAKGVGGVEAKTTGYSTWQTSERGKPVRWRVVQTIALESSDFAALASLVSRLQEDGLLLSGMHFTVQPDTRRRTEDALTEQAIRSWQQRAGIAAAALGYSVWRPGRISINTGDAPSPPAPYLRQRMAGAAAEAAPVAVEAGTTEITVTVSGEALLERK